MLIRVFRFQRYVTVTTAQPTNAGIHPERVVTVTPLRQNTTSIPIIAAGSAFPNFSIHRGILLPPRNAKKGRNRIAAVTSAITATVIHT